MAFYKCEPSGGTLSETKLWELDPSKQTSSFADQTVTLSSSIENYTYLKIYFRQSTSTATETSIIIETTELSKQTRNSYSQLGGALHLRASSSASHNMRVYYYISTTQIYFGPSNVVGGSSTSNGNLIPTKIVGMK